jgi:alkylation response protein AidB-like acyl-CoA dehydrogenase
VTAMEFTWTEEQQRFRDEVRRFAAAELNEDVPGRDDQERFDDRAWKRCAAFGVQGLPVPEEFGGQGADPLTVVLAMEALGYACTDNGLLFSLNAHMWSCEAPLVRFGSDLQRRRYLPALCDGSLIGVQAMSEPGSGSDAFSMSSRAERSGDGWNLNGTKTFVTNAPVADLFVVFASTNPEAKFAGISAFLVERSWGGVSVGRPFRKMGLRTSPMSEVAFVDCDVPYDALLGAPGAGMAIFNHSMLWERSCILATAVGTMERLLERSVEHARERQQFGRPIGAFQAVSHRIADMRVRLETARMLVYRQAWLLDRGEATALDAAMVKAHVSEAFLQTTLDAVQTHGAYGYLVDAELERMVRDAVGSRIYSGTSEIQRNIIAGQLGL